MRATRGFCVRQRATGSRLHLTTIHLLCDGKSKDHASSRLLHTHRDLEDLNRDFGDSPKGTRSRSLRIIMTILSSKFILEAIALLRHGTTGAFLFFSMYRSICERDSEDVYYLIHTPATEIMT